jgi:Septum formation
MRKFLISSILTGAMALTACGDGDAPVASGTASGSASSTQAPMAASAPVKAQEVTVFKIKVGDCLNSDPNAGSVESMDKLDCSAPHLYEAYHSEMLADGDFPGEKSVSDSGDTVCKAHFEKFIGKGFDDSELTLLSLYPSSESWKQENDREIICMITTQDDSKRSGSAKNSKI